MGIRWKFTMGRLLIWIFAEVVFSMLGMDDLADYSEFLFETDTPILISQEFTMK